LYWVRNCSVKDRDLEELLLRIFDSLGDSLWNFLRLAVSDTDGALLISDNNERCEGETTSTLNNLRYAVNEDNALCVRRLLFFRSSITTITTWAAVIATLATLATSASWTI
jgi:hypothetical protein